MAITIDVACETCNGDGYLAVSLADWNAYQTWCADPTEDKIRTPDNFPPILKQLHLHFGVSVGKNVTFFCPHCGGTKITKKNLTLDDLKNILK
jgi:hypothetical protein